MIVRGFPMPAPADGDPTFRFDLPRGARLLSVTLASKTVRLWAEVEPGAELEQRVVRAFSQGEPLPERRRFINTIIAGLIDWHLYEIFP